MTDDLDAVLRARLERLAHAVPVHPERSLEPVVSGHARYRHGNPIGTLVAAVLILVVVLVAAYAAVGRGQPAVVDTVSDGMFRLSIQATKGTYDAEEPIDVVATLEYVGQDPATEVRSHPGMPGFGVEQVDGTNRVDPAYRGSCVSYSFVRGQPVAYPFAKSGRLHDEMPDASFIAEYLNVTDGRADPVLRLPPGTWRIFAVADFAEGDCGGVMHTLEAGITVVVGISASSTALPSASVIALSSTPSPIPPATATPCPPSR